MGIPPENDHRHACLAFNKGVVAGEGQKKKKKKKCTEHG